jgi:uncharacterized membrane protein
MEPTGYRERLAGDLARWRIEGIITPDQERAMLARAGAGAPGGVRALRMGWLITAVSIIGALLLSAGVILLFAANWEEMPDLFRTVLVITSMLAAYAIAYVLMERLELQRLGSAFLLLGTLLFQAAIFLLAQIYNMPVDSPIIFLLGSLGALPLAYLFASRIVALLAVADFTTWLVWSMLDRYEDADEAWAALIVVAVFGIALYGVGRLHALRRAIAPLGDVYVFAGIVITLALVYVFTFDEPWDEILSSTIDAYAGPPAVYVAIIAAFALVAAQLVTLPRTRELLAAAGAQVGLLGLAAVVATWPEWSGYAVVFNAVYFAVAAAIVVRGYATADERYINLGLAAVALGLLTRYCDVFWSLLANSAFFLVGGALLLVVAFVLERARRELLRTMDDEDNRLAEALA